MRVCVYVFDTPAHAPTSMAHAAIGLFDTTAHAPTSLSHAAIGLSSEVSRFMLEDPPKGTSAVIGLSSDVSRFVLKNPPEGISAVIGFAAIGLSSDVLSVSRFLLEIPPKVASGSSRASTGLSCFPGLFSTGLSGFPDVPASDHLSVSNDMYMTPGCSLQRALSGQSGRALGLTLMGPLLF